ncbi:hypothetical protein [Streptomyces sp. NPDC002187]
MSRASCHFSTWRTSAAMPHRPGKDITRIDFGGRYVRTLDEFAGPTTDA